MQKVASELDARGLQCPMPILKTRKALSDLEVGALLRVVSTDPGSIKDFPAFAEQTGHQLIEQEERDGEYTFLIQKSDQPASEEE